MKAFAIECTCENDLLQNLDLELEKEPLFVHIFSGFDEKTSLSFAQEVARNFPNATIVGSSSDELQNSFVVNITQMEGFEFVQKEVFLGEDVHAQGADLARFFGSKPSFIMQIFDLNHEKMQEFLDGFYEKSTNAKIIGGSASSKNTSFVFTQKQSLQNACICVGFYANVCVSFDYFGAKILAQEFDIELSDPHTITKIAGLSPLRFYEKYLGKQESCELKDLVHSFVPILVRDGWYIDRPIITSIRASQLVFEAKLIDTDKICFGITQDEFGDLDVHNFELGYFCDCFIKTSSQNTSLHAVGFKKLNPKSFFDQSSFEYPFKDRHYSSAKIGLFLRSSQEHCGANVIKKTSSINKLYHFIDTLSKENQDINTSLQKTVLEQTNELEQTNKRLLRQLYTDDLTNLANKNAFSKELEQNDPRWLMIVDIKSFNNINDLYGEKMGNIILKSFAAFLQAEIRGRGLVFRFYADHFGILNTSSHEQSSPIYLATSIIHSIELSNFYFEKENDKIEFDLSLRIGIDESTDPNKILSNADMALQYAKRIDRAIVLYSKDLNIEQVYEKYIRVIRMVKQAIEEDRVLPFFQPIAKKGQLGYECLVRIQTKEGSIASPMDFLDTIKNTKYYNQITQIMIKKSFEKFKDLNNGFSINLDHQDIQNRQTKQFLIEQINEHKIGDRLIVEILESENIKDHDNLKSFLKDLRQLGVKVAIDDFGSAYSNFIRLLDIAPDFLKIDGSLIKNINSDKEVRNITSHIIHLAKDLGIQTVAEFVYSQEICENVYSLGIDAVQGYHIGEPSPELLKNEEFIIKNGCNAYS